MTQLSAHLVTDSSRSTGQALAEFALAATMFLVLIGAIIQFGLIMWSQNTVTGVARDTARWAVTQSDQCDSMRSSLAATADQLAVGRALIGYSAGTWSSAPSISLLGPQGVGADWQYRGTDPPPETVFDEDCPPSDNRMVWTVRVRVNHVVPIYFPGMNLLAPSCTDAGWCISSETELRMEPKKR